MTPSHSLTDSLRSLKSVALDIERRTESTEVQRRLQEEIDTVTASLRAQFPTPQREKSSETYSRKKYYPFDASLQVGAEYTSQEAQEEEQRWIEQMKSRPDIERLDRLTMHYLLQINQKLSKQQQALFVCFADHPGILDARDIAKFSRFDVSLVRSNLPRLVQKNFLRWVDGEGYEVPDPELLKFLVLRYNRNFLNAVHHGDIDRDNSTAVSDFIQHQSQIGLAS